MDNCNRSAKQRQQCIAKQAQTADTHRFFSLLTSPELLKEVEAQLPEYAGQTPLYTTILEGYTNNSLI